MTEKNKIHRGAILYAVAKRSIKTITKITKDAGYEKSTFYLHIKQADLPLEILYKYGNSIPHRFDNEIPAMAQFISDSGIIIEDDKKHTYEAILKDRDYWKDRCLALLEENNKLLRERLN